MYRKILVCLDTTISDQELIPHVSQLARLVQCELLLLHVADGWVARNFNQLNLAESEEMKEDWKYLDTVAQRLRSETSLKVDARLALGDPPKQILSVAKEEQCDLIAFASHGHKLVGDLIHGSTIEAVRHNARVPLIVVPARQKSQPASAHPA